MTYLAELLSAGILVPTGVEGVYGKNYTFERVIDGLYQAISKLGKPHNPEIMQFPPILPLSQLKASGYFKGFPQLAGTVHCFCGNEKDHIQLLQCVDTNDDSWTKKQEAAGVALNPAVCYPIYPAIALRGPLGENGLVVNAYSYCYRHEPSLEPTRMQMFRVHEWVKFGNLEQVIKFREDWIELGSEFAKSLALPFEVDLANDPFFGRGGKVAANSQRELKLKFELLIPVDTPENPVACMSFNYHINHFSEIWDIRLPNGDLAYTACVGFGMERIVLALFKHHGFDLNQWPSNVKTLLWS